MEFVDSIFRQDTTIPEVADKTVASIVIPNTDFSIDLSTKVMQELKLAQPLSKSLMNGVWKLFEKRDQRIFYAHKEVNDGKQHYVPFKRSYFVLPQFLETLLLDLQPADNNNNRDAILDEYFPERAQMTSIHRAYFLEKLREDTDCFCLLIADFDLRCLFYIEPTCAEAFRSNDSERATHLCEVFNRFLDRNIEANLRGPFWPITRRFGNNVMKCPAQQTDFDSGMYVFLFVYYFVHDCPAIFDESDVTRMRKQLAYWLLKEYLPM